MPSSRRRLRVFAAALLLLCLTPGAGEAVEQIVHLVSTGHVAHLTEGESDLEHDEEHGCQPNAHACGCCTNVPVVQGPVVKSMVAREPSRLLARTDASPPRDRAAEQVFRPPIQS